MDQLTFLIFIALIHAECFCCIFKRSTEKVDESKWKLLNHELCGLATTDRIVGGEEAAIGQYPWIARVGYTRHAEEPTFKCGAAIISEYYCITAAHCIDDDKDGLKITKVRLGEHNADTNPDCVGDRCNDPYVDYPVEEIKSHECYGTPNFRNDIALLRIGRRIQFTEFIRPICMLNGDLLKTEFVGGTAEVAGWGVTDPDGPKLSTVLRTLTKPVVNNSVCVTGYRKVSTISGEQMCAGGKVGKDSCSGDSGGPLMKVLSDDTLGPRYYLIGIVSFGSKMCGKKNLPGVYTRMSTYIPWLLRHIKPHN